MIKEGHFKICFKASILTQKPVKMSESFFLPYRTEETHMHESSTVHRHAIKKIKQCLGDCSIEIKHIYELTDYEEIKY